MTTHRVCMGFAHPFKIDVCVCLCLPCLCLCLLCVLLCVSNVACVCVCVCVSMCRRGCVSVWCVCARTQRFCSAEPMLRLYAVMGLGGAEVLHQKEGPARKTLHSAAELWQPEDQ